MAHINLMNPTIPLGSVILVTGANGLIASWPISILMKGAALRPRHGPGRFELVEMSDFGTPGAWDMPVRGVAGIAAVAGSANLDLLDIDGALKVEFPFVSELLRAAKDEPNVKSVIFTSSAWAAWTPDPSRKGALHEWPYNDDAVRLVLRAEKPSYTFNTILPETIFGATQSPEHQGIQSTCGMVKWLREGWFIDTQDLAALYVKALTTPGVNGERLFAFGNKYSFSKVAQLLRKLEPEE
ncbi:hypothetical protein F5Y14DRAFT_441359 [Nemania sp. NC0429]|nr:hypothetical protein F5Y14DRAFT_441359 [Nemania sp. NC0429]